MDTVKSGPGPACKRCFHDDVPGGTRVRHTCTGRCDAFSVVGGYAVTAKQMPTGHSIEDAFDPPPIPSWVKTVPPRVAILNDAAKLTNGDRDKEYGPPARNMACAGEFKAVFRKYLARPISAAEQEAIDMVLTKVSRLACGKPKRDTYVDGASYMAIAGECAE